MTQEPLIWEEYFDYLNAKNAEALSKGFLQECAGEAQSEEGEPRQSDHAAESTDERG